MKRILFILLAFVAFNASAQLPYPTNTFWQFLEGFQGGDSTTQNYMEYKNSSLLMRRTGSDVKVFQVKNDVSNSGVLTGFLDEQKNGGFAVDSSDGTTVVKLRGGLDAHTYFMNNYFSIGRAGNSQQYGGTVDGARFTVNDGNRDPFTGLGSADNFQMMVQSSSDSLGKGAGIAFTNENAAKDVNVGGAIVYEKTGNNGKGALNFYAKESQGDLADPIKYLRLGGDTASILSDNTKIIGALNLEGLTVDNNADSVLLFSNDTVYKNSLSSISENIYNTDGTLTGNRTITSGGFDLSFDGNLGIGTATPSEKLSVVGKMYLNDGGNSVFIGEGAGRVDDASDNRNVGIGYQALFLNTTGYYNTANGYQALFSNTTGFRNTANGNQALYLNTTGFANTANGNQALYSNTTGYYNTANGYQALRFNTTGSQNTAIGNGALYSNTTGGNNVAIGYGAGRFLADGVTAATNVANSLFLGVNTYPLADGQENQTVIGYDAKGIGSNTVVLGNDNVVTTALKGDVGIGTTSPAGKLDVQDGTGTQTAGDLMVDATNHIVYVGQLDNVSGNTNLIFRNRLGGYKSIFNNAGAGTILFADFTNNKGFKIQYSNAVPDTNPNTNALFEVTASSQANAAVFTGGNVGIGTTSPSAQIHADNTETTGVGAIIENSNASNTANIAEFQNSTGTVAKVGVNGGIVAGSSTLSASAVLQANSTTKGFLPPRMTGAQAEAIATPAEGLMVYATDGSGVTITSKGWWGYEGSTWVKLN